MGNPNTIDYPHGVTVIDTHYYREKLAASHLIIENGKAAFVDVGTTPAFDYLLQALREKRLNSEDVHYIILTHIHLDHAGCAGTLMKHCPNATLVVHPRGARHIINPEKLINATLAIYGKENFANLYREILPVTQERVHIAEDNAELDFQGRKLHFFDTPGHARHHFCVWDPTSKGIFTGDTMGIAYPELQIAGKPPFLIPTTSPVAFDPTALKQSILRLQELEAETFYLTHYGPIKAVPEAVQSLIEMIEKHAEIGLSTAKGDLQSLKSQLFNLYFEAYCTYTGSNVDMSTFKTILAGDLELNAQGVEIWSSRQ